MALIKIYTTSNCYYCRLAKALLKRKNIKYQEIDVEYDASRREEMIIRSGRRTVPQIFINDTSIGGYDDLNTLNTSGNLDKLLANNHVKRA